VLQLKIKNGKLRIIVSDLPTISIYFRRKYLHFQFLIINFQFGR